MVKIVLFAAYSKARAQLETEAQSGVPTFEGQKVAWWPQPHIATRYEPLGFLFFTHIGDRRTSNAGRSKIDR